MPNSMKLDRMKGQSEYRLKASHAAIRQGESVLDIRRLTETLCVSGQIVPADLPAVVAAGFRSVVCNRPDGEAEGQVSFAQLAAAASHADLGLEFHCLPVVSGRVTATDGRRFAELIARIAPPVLAYCRSGTRSATLWALSEIGKMPRSEILERAAHAGYDLSRVIPPDRDAVRSCTRS